MAYPEYTKCTTVNGALTHRKDGIVPWNDMIAAGIAAGVSNAAAAIIIAGIVDAVTASLAAWVAGLSLVIFAVVAILTYCDWWLKFRLICLDGNHNHCAVGFVADMAGSGAKSFPGNLDTDFTLNIGVFRTWFFDKNIDMANLDEVSQVKPFGHLLKSTAANDAPRAANDPLLQTMQFDLTGMTSPEKLPNPYAGMPKMQILHAEFEGGAVKIFRDWLRVILAMLVAAEALEVACNAGLFWACILALVLILFVVPVTFAGGLSHALSDQANPGEIDKSLETLSIGNIVIVSGRWVYDAGHVDEDKGWNEIHPIRRCQIIRDGVFDGEWFNLNAEAWCDEFEASESALVKAEQDKDENKWEIHPCLDGCIPAQEPPTSRGPTIANVSNVSSYNVCAGGYTVTASASGPSGIAKLELWYKYSTGTWQVTEMVLNPGTGLYEATLSQQLAVTYYVRAFGNDGRTADSRPYSTLLYCVI